MNVYRCKCKMDYSNGDTKVTVKEVDTLVCAENPFEVPKVLHLKLCKDRGDSISNCIMEEIQLSNGDVFVLNS